MRAIHDWGCFLYRSYPGRFPCGLLAVAAIVVTAPTFAAADPVYTTLHAFTGGADGALSGGDSLVRNGGIIYGVAAKGGKDSCPGGCGLVYTLTPTADPSVWQKRTIYRFAGGGKGYQPRGQLLFGKDGALYGVASRGGFANSACADSPDTGCGLVYKLTPPDTPGALWIYTVLYRFKNYDDGIFPIGGLVMKDGALYGTTTQGGGSSNGGNAFKLKPPTDANPAWTKTTLAFFKGLAGVSPTAALTFSGGKFYGTTTTGSSASASGAVFELVPPASPAAKWTLNVLHSFSQADGFFPAFVKVAFDADGRIYGTTAKGGANCGGGPPGCGVVFRLTPPTAPATQWAYETIYRFQPGSNGFGDEGGAVPVGGVVFDAAGALYGVTSQAGANGGGVIYKLTPPPDDVGSWAETVLYSNANSNVPQAPLILSGQSLFGTLAGALFGTGEAFRLKQ
jgi:uncharacterized repeat protein (TIGR03803 family)